jgi:hypothetical protein
MSDLEARIARYRRAAECLRIAEQASDHRVRAHYIDLAESYLKPSDGDFGLAVAALQKR